MATLAEKVSIINERQIRSEGRIDSLEARVPKHKDEHKQDMRLLEKVFEEKNDTTEDCIIDIRNEVRGIREDIKPIVESYKKKEARNEMLVSASIKAILVMVVTGLCAAVWKGLK